MATTRKVIIIGSGPAGYTAAIYTARANLSPVMFTGIQAGGQLMLTTLVENYPGFVDGIDGPPLMETFQKQAQRFGTEMIAEDVTSVDFSKRPFRVTAGDTTLESHAVIIATGATAKLLGLENETRLMGRGVSTCATCDGFFFKGQAVVVVGGGNTAVEEALYLANICSGVVLVHRRDRFRAEKIMIDKLMKRVADGKIRLELDAVVEEVLGDARGVSGVRVRKLKTGESKVIVANGFFVAIGHTPNTGIFAGQLEMQDGYIVTRGGREGFATATSVPGVFAAGDVQDHVYRQAVTSAASGCMAALDAEKFLDAGA
jgi:thioredoxin reductase (NADPH)